MINASRAEMKRIDIWWLGEVWRREEDDPCGTGNGYATRLLCSSLVSLGRWCIPCIIL